MKKCLLILGALLVSGSVQADIRVLFRFDESGHFVHRIIQTASQRQLSSAKRSHSENSHHTAKPVRPETASPIDRGRDWQNASIPTHRRTDAGLSEEFATLVWLDASGDELIKTEVSDPRIVHSPSHAEGFNASQSGLAAGAWLATGPDLAVRVHIFLPESVVLGLPSEVWILELMY